MIARLKRNDVLIHGAIVFGGVIVSNLCNYLFYMLIGRRAGVTTYGEVTSLASVLLALGAPASVGQLIAARIAAGLDAEGDKASLRRLGDLVTMWTGAAALLVVAVALIEREPIASFFNLQETAPVVVTAVALGILLVAYVQRGVLQGAHLFADFSASLAFETVPRLVLGVVLVVPFGASGALSGIVAGLMLSAAYNIITFHRRFGGGRARIPFDRPTLTRIVTGVGLGQVTLTVLTFYDVPLVKHAFDAHAAGVYSAATLVGRAVLGACTFVPTLILPKAHARVMSGRSPQPLLFAALGIAASIVGVAVLATAIAPEQVVTAIAGPSFREAAPYALLYVLAIGALSLACVVAAYNFGLHRYEFVRPVLVTACGEVTALALWHPTLFAVVTVLAIGHACVLAATLYRVGAPVSLAQAAASDPEPYPGSEPIG